MQTVYDLKIFDRYQIKEDKFWNLGDSKELLMHRIHSYPAKFPSFLTPKIVNYLRKQGVNIESMADIFCGCGTSALESRILGIDFWGFDINPVATLIAKTKSHLYDSESLQFFFQEIIKHSNQNKKIVPQNILLNERINYWFSQTSIKELYSILSAIHSICPNNKYRNFFLTAFSNILKPCSMWLTKSIKPQFDPNKIPSIPLESFSMQFEVMKKASLELEKITEFDSNIEIHTRNILRLRPSTPFVDLIITSPPYVTSYEYADLHQLSTLWLGYVEDYKELRKGTIGSEYHYSIANDKHSLNPTGKKIYEKLVPVDKSKSNSVRKYFQDIEQTVKQTKLIVRKSGFASFVIGNTKYKNVLIDNAKFLTHCLIENNFSDIKITKRKISTKILTPFRDKYGQFSTNSKGKKVYSHEYLIMAKN